MITTNTRHSSSSIKATKGVKGIQTRKEVVNVLLFSDDMIVSIREPKNSTRKLQMRNILAKWLDMQLT